MDQRSSLEAGAPTMFSLQEAARLLRCSVTWLQAQRASGTVPHHRRCAHRGTYFTAEDLCAIIASHARAPAGSCPPPLEPVESGRVPRVYTRAEAAAALGMPESTLRDQVTAALVPHHRRGRSKGVYFTDADLASIRAAQFRPSRPPADDGHRGAGGSRRPKPASSAIPAEFADLRARR